MGKYKENTRKMRENARILGNMMGFLWLLMGIITWISQCYCVSCCGFAKWSWSYNGLLWESNIHYYAALLYLDFVCAMVLLMLEQIDGNGLMDSWLVGLMEGIVFSEIL